jgi:replicative DNA helicase Mcm
MEPTLVIKKFQEYLEKYHASEIAEKARKGEKFLNIDFVQLSMFDPEITEELLEEPEEVLKAGELALEQFEVKGDLRNFNIRIMNVPESMEIMVKDVRSVHINKLLYMQGLVRQKSDVRPQVTSARFECPSCGNIITVLQLDSKFKEPSRCGCGRKGKFRELSRELVDAQKIVLEEDPGDLDGGEQPKRIDIFLKSDLVSPISEKKSSPGSKVKIVGVLKEVPILARDGGKLTRFDLMIEVNYIEPIEEDFLQLKISEDEEKEIKDLAHHPDVYQKIVDSLAPTIYGHDKIKQALIFQAFGGLRKTRKKGSPTRGDIHILLIGDPGAGKSQLLKRISEIAPKARYVSGKGASGAGLTATVVKDEFIKGYALEAGALVLANRGICCIDELDKMTKEDRSAMHEALEQQTVTISKANIQATLRCETTVLAAANPKFGRFDPYEVLAKQIELPSTLINRFDLIFPIRDMPDEVKDERLAAFILSLHKDKKELVTEISNDLLRKYFAYARQTAKPVLTDAAIKEIKDYYVKMRTSGSDDGGVKAIPITARQLEALIRLSEASAKIRLSDKVTKEDSTRAIELVHHCLSQIGMDPETGKFDIDRISSGVTASERGNIVIVKEIINEQEVKSGKTIPVEDILIEASEKGITEDKVIEVIEKLKRSGDIYEPKKGFISKI